MENYRINDLDSNIARKKELIEKVKAMKEDETIDYRQLSFLQKDFNRIPDQESAYENELYEEFETYLNELYARRSETYAVNAKNKEEVIAKTQKLLDGKDFRHVYSQLNELMDEWKTIPTCGQEKDDELWEKFHNLRQSVFEKRHEYYDSLKEVREKALEVKKAIIEEAKAIDLDDDIIKLDKQFSELMNRWKEVGGAGKEFEEDLWNEFKAIRDTFYAKKHVYFAELHEKHNASYKQKLALIEEIKKINDDAIFSKEVTEQVKNLNERWKAAGSCGRKEEKTWKVFRSEMDIYFDSLRANSEQRQANRIARLNEAKSRKLDMINREKKHIEHLKNSLNEILGETALNEAMEEIKEREAFVLELEEQVADIEKNINN